MATKTKEPLAASDFLTARDLAGRLGVKAQCEIVDGPHPTREAAVRAAAGLTPAERGKDEGGERLQGEGGRVKTEAKRGPRAKVEPVLICKTEIAAHLGVSDTATIDTWIEKGTFPPPHSRPGERFAVWRRSHWNAYVETGSWPSEAFGKSS